MSGNLLKMDEYLAKSLTRPNAADASAQAIDPEVLASLDEAWEDGEPDLVVELIDLYLRDSLQWVEAMRAAAAADNATVLKRAAHTLKGSSGSLGVRQVAEACRMLEQLPSSDSATVAELLQQLDRDFATARAALAAERLRRVA